MSEQEPVAYLHAFEGLTDEQLEERKQFYAELYWQTLDTLEAIEVARDGISYLIRQRRQAARAAEQRAEGAL